MSKQRIILITAAVGLLLLGGLIWFVFFRGAASATLEQTQDVLPQGAEVKPIESSVKVSVKAIENNKKVRLTIDAIPAKYQTIEYDLLYDAKDGVPRGVQGTITVDGPSYEKNIVLGSCSTNICTYDEGVTEVKLTMRFSTGDSWRVFEKTFSL